MFPQHVAERLKNGEAVAAEAHDQVATFPPFRPPSLPAGAAAGVATPTSLLGMIGGGGGGGVGAGDDPLRGHRRLHEHVLRGPAPRSTPPKHLVSLSSSHFSCLILHCFLAVKVFSCSLGFQ